MKYPTLILSVVLTLFFTIAVGNAQESPLTVSGAVTIDANRAKELYDRAVPFIDVRTQEAWEAAKIPGSHNLDLFDAFNKPSLMQIAGKNEDVVIYCSGPVCKRSSKACAKAVSWEFTNVYYFRGGFPEWQAAGYPSDPP